MLFSLVLYCEIVLALGAVALLGGVLPVLSEALLLELLVGVTARFSGS